MIRYMELGADKKLNSIVMAGSHDAAVTAGSWNAKTQNLDIFDQAVAGIRIFDIRITGAVVGKSVELKAYHGQGGKSDKQMWDPTARKMVDVKVKSMTLGTYGSSLTSILNDAYNFVRIHTSEFIILKFDKCDNWPQIAEACVRLLDDKLCDVYDNLNERTLDDLKGKVIVLFSQKGLQALGANTHGIMAFDNLADSGNNFNNDHKGIQYFGKGGTGLLDKRTGAKVADNIKKQTELMQRGSQTDPKIMGMMYWTATGIVGNIRRRNNDLWSESNQKKMIEMWAQRLPGNADMTGYSTSPLLKRFLPNFVMIDFADSAKCKKIYELNHFSQHAMTKKVRRFFDMST